MAKENQVLTSQALYKHQQQHDIDQRSFAPCHPLQEYHKHHYKVEQQHQEQHLPEHCERKKKHIIN